MDRVKQLDQDDTLYAKVAARPFVTREDVLEGAAYRRGVQAVFTTLAS